MAFGIFFANQVSASSNTLNFQSKIVNVADGTNVVSGTPSCVVAGSGNDTCDFRVRIYDASSAGTLLFSETHSNIEIGQYNGIFNLSINSVCASTSTAGTDGNWTSGGCVSNGGVNFSASSLWIEIGFDPAGGGSFTETFSRVQIKDVASARYAVSASYLGGIAAADFVQFKPSGTQTTSSTNSLINLTTTGNTSNPLIYANENGAGTPDLLRLQTTSATVFQVGNGGAVTMAGDLINSSTGTIGLFNTNVTTLNIGGAATTLNLAGGSASTGCSIDTNGNIACTGSGTFGTTSSPQLRVQYDVSNYFTSAVASNGTVTFDSSSANLYDIFTFNDSVKIDTNFGTSDPIPLSVISTSASTATGGSLGSVLLRTTKTGSNAAGSIVGLYSEANFNNTAAGSFSSVVGVSSRPTGGLGVVGANSSVATLVGFESNPYWNSTGTATDIIGLRVNPQGTTNGTRTNEYGVYVGNIVNASNTYGLYIAGAGTYAIWSDAGDNRFDGNLVTGSTSLDVFNTTATTINFGGAATTLNVGISGASGTLALMGGSGSTGCTIDGTNGNFACSGTISGSFSVADDSLDYNKFEDTMDLDANLILNQGAFTWVQNFTGTTTVGQTYNATSLTSGTALSIAAGAGLTTNGELLFLDTGTSTAGNALTITSNAANYAGTGLINIAAASSTAGTGILLTMTGSTTGAGISITNTAAYTGTLGLLRISTTGITSGTGASITAGAGLTTNGELLLLDTGTSTAGNALTITSNAANYAGTGLINVTSASSTAGTGILLTMTGSTTGAAISITNTAAYTGTVGLARISTTGITSGTALGIASGNNLTTNGELIDLNMGASTAGNGLNVTTTGAYTGTGLVVLTANTAQTGTIQSIAANALTSGVGLSITGTGTGVTTGSMLRISTGTTGAVATNGIVSLTATGNYTSTSNVGLLTLTANATAAGTVQSIFANALTTGVGLSINSSSTAMTTASLLSINASGANTAFTGNLAYIGFAGNNASNTGDLLELEITGASSLARGLYISNAGLGNTIAGSTTITPGAASTASLSFATVTSGDSSGTQRGLNISSSGAPSTGQTQSAIFGATVLGLNTGAGTITTGYALTTSYTNSSTGTISGANGIYTQIANTSTGTITGAIGLQIASAVNSGGGTFTTNYGIRIDSQTAGATDYGLYITGADTYSLVVASGVSRFLGKVEVDTSDTTGNSASIVSNSLTTGSGLSISTSTTSSTAWNLVNLTSSGINGTGGTLLRLTTSSTSATSNSLIIDGYQAGGILFQVNDVASDTTPFQITVDGDVVVGNALTVPGLLSNAANRSVCVTNGTGLLSKVNGACGTSSIVYKEDVHDLTYGLNEMLQLHPVFFRYKPEVDSDTSRKIGFIAEEVIQIIPEVGVYKDNGVVQTLNYDKLTALSAKAIQELHGIVVGQGNSIQNLTVQMDSQIASINTRLTNAENAISNFQGYTLPSTASFTELLLTGALKVQGQLLLSNKNIGTSTVAAGETEVAITFGTAFPQTPVVVATPIDSFVVYTVKEITQTGFKIAIEAPVAQDIQFNWFVSSNSP